MNRGHRGGAKPMVWGGVSDKCLEWKAKLLAYLRMVAVERTDTWVKWGGQTQKEVVTADAVELGFGADAEQVKQLSSLFHSELTMCSNAGPLSPLQSVAQGLGLEVLRSNMGRYEPRTAQSKQAYLNAIIATPQAKRVAHIGRRRDSSTRPFPNEEKEE